MFYNCWASKRLNNFDNWPSGSTEVKKLLFSNSLNFNSNIIETIEASQLLDVDWVIVKKNSHTAYDTICSEHP